MNIPTLFALLRDSYTAFNEDKVPRLGAALSYYVFSSLAPLLVVAVGIVGIVLGREDAQRQIITAVTTSLGRDTANALNELIQTAAQPSTGVVATIIGTTLTLLAASGIFIQIKDALNTVWDVKPNPPKVGIVYLLTQRLLSIVGILLFGVFVIAFLASRIVLSNFSTQLGLDNPLLLGILSNTLSLGLFTVLFAIAYKYLPDVQLPWKDVWLGAFVTALLFTLGQYLISIYLGRSTATTVYGAAGSLVVILIWVYFSSQILFFGAEVTWVYSQKYGSRSTVADKVQGAETPPAALEDKKAKDPDAGTDKGTKQKIAAEAPNAPKPSSALQTSPAALPSSEPTPQNTKSRVPSSVASGLAGAGVGAVLTLLMLPFVLLFGVLRLFRRR